MALVAVCNLGCSKNIVDGERMMSTLQDGGHKITTDYSQAEIILVNTCAFIKEAKQEAIEAILSMAEYKKHGKCTTLAVAGCFSERYRKQVREEFPEVDAWIGVTDWAEELRSLLGGGLSTERHIDSRSGVQYVKIAEGCSHGCSFCVIPSIRGAFRSRPAGEIIDEARWLYDQGARECILVSQDTSLYGHDIGAGLVGLLEQLLAKTSFPWIRMMYLNPWRVDDGLIRLVASETRLCSYFDIPLQHIADPVLRAMNRPSRSADIHGLVQRVRTLAPGATLRTTFILGFPGETETDFKRLLKFVEWARFEKMGVFPYSPEEGTRAYRMRGRPRDATVARRSEELMDVQREISRQLLAEQVGRTLPVMIDSVSESDSGLYEGRTQYDAPEVDGAVYVTGENIRTGAFSRVRIVRSDDYDLHGETTA